MEVRFPFRQGSATLATGQCIYMFLVQVVALIVWQQGVHFLLSIQNMLMGWYFAVYPCRVVSRSVSDIRLLQCVHYHLWQEAVNRASSTC